MAAFFPVRFKSQRPAADRAAGAVTYPAEPRRRVGHWHRWLVALFWGATVGTAAAQVWSPQVSGTLRSLYSVWGADASTLWSVGANGTILRTGNGGVAWSTQVSGTTATLTDVWSSDAMTAWTVGDGGTIRKTIDGGTLWTAQGSGTNQILYSVWGVDASIVWAVGNGGILLKTSDGGTTWMAQTSNTTQTLLGVWAADASTVWAVGANGTILKTVDGGTTWTPQTANTTQNLLGVWGGSALVAWAVGSNGTIIKTVDGGSTWIPQSSGTTQFLNAVYGQNANTLVAVGGSGTIIGTTNGGATWTAQVSGTTQQLRAVYLTSTLGWAVGDLGTILLGTDVALPVRLRYFSGRFTPAGALLGWQTTAERNSAYFNVERSTDARSFDVIAHVPSQMPDGGTDRTQTYEFTDTRPGPGIKYYRLTQVDSDGTRTPSKIIALSREGQPPVLYPNPVGSGGEAVLEPALAYRRYEVVDLLGRVRQQVDEPGTLSRLSVGTLPEGVYLLRIEQAGGGWQSFRLIR